MWKDKGNLGNLSFTQKMFWFLKKVGCNDNLKTDIVKSLND